MSDFALDRQAVFPVTTAAGARSAPMRDMPQGGAVCVLVLGSVVLWCGVLISLVV